MLGPHVASDAVAGHGEPLRVHLMREPVLSDPFDDGIALFDGRRVSGLGAETVLREHDRGVNDNLIDNN